MRRHHSCRRSVLLFGRIHVFFRPKAMDKMRGFLLGLWSSLFCMVLLFSSTLTAPASEEPANASNDDPYLWLENVTGEKSLDWVKEQNAISTKELEAAPEFEVIRKRVLAIMDSKEKIPFVIKHGRFYYNFWRDDQHVRGVFRRTSLEEYKKPDPKWEVVVDMDALAQSEHENWVWKGYEVLYPSYD